MTNENIDATNGSELPSLEEKFIKAFVNCKISDEKERNLIAWGWLVGQGIGSGGAAMRVWDMGFLWSYKPWEKSIEGEIK